MKRWMSFLGLSGALLISAGCQDKKPAAPPADAASMADAISKKEDDSHGHSHGS